MPEPNVDDASDVCILMSRPVEQRQISKVGAWQIVK